MVGEIRDPGDGADRDPVGADRSPGVHHGACQQCRRRRRPLPQHECRTLQLRFGAELHPGPAAGAADLRDLQAAGQGPRRAACSSRPSIPRATATTPSYEGKGCIDCNGTGYRGRTAIAELLDMSDRIREMILQNKPGSDIKRAAKEEGMTFLREAALAKAFAGKTTLHEINKVTFVDLSEDGVVDQPHRSRCAADEASIACSTCARPIPPWSSKLDTDEPVRLVRMKRRRGGHVARGAQPAAVAARERPGLDLPPRDGGYDGADVEPAQELFEHSGHASRPGLAGAAGQPGQGQLLQIAEKPGLAAAAGRVGACEDASRRAVPAGGLRLSYQLLAGRGSQVESPCSSSSCAWRSSNGSSAPWRRSEHGSGLVDICTTNLLNLSAGDVGGGLRTASDTALLNCARAATSRWSSCATSD